LEATVSLDKKLPGQGFGLFLQEYLETGFCMSVLTVDAANTYLEELELCSLVFALIRPVV
jgi:hypothetical protein